MTVHKEVEIRLYPIFGTLICSCGQYVGSSVGCDVCIGGPITVPHPSLTMHSNVSISYKQQQQQQQPVGDCYAH
jgi:hypothetical protein